MGSSNNKFSGVQNRWFPLTVSKLAGTATPLDEIHPPPHNKNDKFLGDIMPISNYESLKGDIVDG